MKRIEADAGIVLVFGGESPYGVLDDAIALSVDSLGPVVENFGVIAIGTAAEDVSWQYTGGVNSGTVENDVEALPVTVTVTVVVFGTIDQTVTGSHGSRLEQLDVDDDSLFGVSVLTGHFSDLVYEERSNGGAVLEGYILDMLNHFMELKEDCVGSVVVAS